MDFAVECHTMSGTWNRRSIFMNKAEAVVKSCVWLSDQLMTASESCWTLWYMTSRIYYLITMMMSPKASLLLPDGYKRSKWGPRLLVRFNWFQISVFFQPPDWLETEMAYMKVLIYGWFTFHWKSQAPLSFKKALLYSSSAVKDYKKVHEVPLATLKLFWSSLTWLISS